MKDSRVSLVENDGEKFNEIGNSIINLGKEHHRKKKYKEAIKAFQQAMVNFSLFRKAESWK